MAATAGLAGFSALSTIAAGAEGPMCGEGQLPTCSGVKSPMVPSAKDSMKARWGAVVFGGVSAF